MGWGSAVRIFDKICKSILESDGVQEHVKSILIKDLVIALEEADWDTQPDSDYWDHPIVRKIMNELHPSWFEEE